MLCCARAQDKHDHISVTVRGKVVIPRSDVQLLPADTVSVYERVTVMNAAYIDYYIPMKVSAEYMRLVDRANDVDHSRSVIARVRGRTIGIALVGLRSGRAWIGGVGVVPEWRRRGVARAMMRRIQEDLRDLGVRNVILEVLIQNDAARRLYGMLGFVGKRDLLSWYRRPDSITPDQGPTLTPVPADVLLMRSQDWLGSDPSWQNERSALRRMSEHLQGYTLTLDDDEAAFCVVNDRTTTVSVMSVGVRPGLDHGDAARQLLDGVIASYPQRAVHLTNLSADDPLCRLLPQIRFAVTAHQLEMSCAVG